MNVILCENNDILLSTVHSTLFKINQQQQKDGIYWPTLYIAGIAKVPIASANTFTYSVIDACLGGLADAVCLYV